MAIAPQQIVSDWFQKTAEAMDAALKTAAKFQEESIQCWTGMMGGSGSIHDWQKNAQAMAMEAIPAAQKGAEEYVHAMEQTYSRGLDLLRKAFESGESRSIEDVQSRVHALWEDMLAAIRANTQAFLQANTKAMESWAGIACKRAG